MRFIDQPGREAPLAVGADILGPVGFDDEITFTAPETGSYLIVTSDARRTGSGAYLITITPS